MCSYNYANIKNFGSGAAYAPINNPLSYLMSSGLDNMFMHGSPRLNSDTRESQAYIAEYCAKGFDKFCEVATANTATQIFPNLLHGCVADYSKDCLIPKGWCVPQNLTKGDVVLINTAKTKYLQKMYGAFENKVPFDCTVAASPLITLYSGEWMKPVYSIPQGLDLDNDPVMNRILNKPMIALDLLSNIYCTMRDQNRLGELAGTKLGTFYNNMIKNMKKLSN